MEQAFVIGNGPSRLAIELETLRGHGTIYGCNALYRDFLPDVLVAVDLGMKQEIEKKGINKQIPFYTHKPNPDSLKIPVKRGMWSGPTAMAMACLEDTKKVFMLGFDMNGTNDTINNIYAGTLNYKLADHKPINYIKMIENVIKVVIENPDVEFIRVGDNLHVPDEWDMTNLSHCSIADFKDYINKLNKEI